MICPNCGIETPGVNHNNRGLRCTGCWGRLPAPVGSEAIETPDQPAEPVVIDDGVSEAEGLVEPALSEAKEPDAIDPADGASEAEASAAGKALNQKKKSKAGK